MIAAVFFTIHFVLLDAWTGAAMNILAALRAYVFNLRDSKWYIDHPLVVYLFIDLFWIGGLLTWDGFHSILPVISLTLECFALWSKKTKYIRWILLSSFPFWTIYHIIVGSYAGIATESFVAISIIVSIIRFDVLKKIDNQKMIKEIYTD